MQVRNISAILRIQTWPACQVPRLHVLKPHDPQQALPQLGKKSGKVRCHYALNRASLWGAPHSLLGRQPAILERMKRGAQAPVSQFCKFGDHCKLPFPPLSSGGKSNRLTVVLRRPNENLVSCNSWKCQADVDYCSSGH